MHDAAALARVLQCVVLAELAEFPHVLLAELTEVVPVHHAGYYEVDPRVPRVVMIRHPPGFAPPPRSAEHGIARHSEHPIAARHAASGDGSALRISDVMTREELHRLPYYREVIEPLGTEYEMAFRLPGPEPVQVVVVLSRSESDFTDAERDLCNLLRQSLSAAQAAAIRADLLRQAIEDHVAAAPGAALVAVDGLRLVALDTCAERFVARLLDGEGMPAPEFASWLYRARAGDAVLDDPVPDRHMTTWTDEHGILEVRHVPGVGGHDLLVVREAGRDVRGVLGSLGLRPREAEVLGLVMAGCSNHDIAGRLGIAVPTVKKHLEGIYRTLDVTTRTGATSAGFQAVGGATAPAVD